MIAIIDNTPKVTANVIRAAMAAKIVSATSAPIIIPITVKNAINNILVVPYNHLHIVLFSTMLYYMSQASFSAFC